MAASREYIENGFLRVSASQNLGTGGSNGYLSANIGETLKFQSMPAELGSTKSASYTPIQILGRANPLWVYGYSDERAWQLELKFFVTDFEVGIPSGFVDPVIENDQVKMNSEEYI